jgi:hypothetical protein
LIFWAKIDDHGVRRGDTGRILNQWRHMVASRVALDLPYWAMRLASYRPDNVWWLEMLASFSAPIVVSYIVTKLVASMSWVEGPFRVPKVAPFLASVYRYRKLAS